MVHSMRHHPSEVSHMVLNGKQECYPLRSQQFDLVLFPHLSHPCDSCLSLLHQHVIELWILILRLIARFGLIMWDQGLYMSRIHGHRTWIYLYFEKTNCLSGKDNVVFLFPFPFPFFCMYVCLGP
jgi:hypothetical protein